MCRGMWRCAQRCTEVCGGVWRYAEVHRGARRYVEFIYSGCLEVFQRGGGEKNQDVMLIRFLNARI